MIKENEYAIECHPLYGPIFGYNTIFIDSNNEENSCHINNNGNKGFECHPEYKSSLFVNTAGPNKRNYFSIFDYEVYYNIDCYKDIIYTLCKNPDIIWNCINKKYVSDYLLSKCNDETELLNDLNKIHYEESTIRFMISKYYLKIPSTLFSNTQIINQQYDSYFKEWIGNYKWKLIYRASEHEYTAKSFHEHCDDKESTLIVIKSSGGWIFGGYTTQSWSGDGIYYIHHTII